MAVRSAPSGTGIDEVLGFWFSDATRARWWDKDAGFDALVRDRFAALHEAAAKGGLAAWEKSAEGALALILTLDQFPRNMYRGTPRAFATDPQARAAADRAIAAGHDLAFPDADRRMFFYLPFEHSEALADQRRCLELVRARCPDETYLKYAVAHLEVIERFGRFPHRNAILGRRNTEAEEAYLADPDAGF